MSHLSRDNRVYPAGHEGEADQEAHCQWFAKCTNLANGVGDAGPLGPLPVCKRCAEVVGMTEFVVGGID